LKKKNIKKLLTKENKNLYSSKISNNKKYAASLFFIFVKLNTGQDSECEYMMFPSTKMNLIFLKKVSVKNAKIQNLQKNQK